MAKGRFSIAAALAVLSFEAAAASSVELPKESPFPESVIAATDGTLFVSSISNGGVLRIKPNGKPEAFVKPGGYGTGTTFGVNLDEKSGTLWVCSN